MDYKLYTPEYVCVYIIGLHSTRMTLLRTGKQRPVKEQSILFRHSYTSSICSMRTIQTALHRIVFLENSI